ncbi:DUF1028 domain-containing protein [Bosea sp. LjRoot9]|uniref:DUF1028 domain-containing protein n=1 Tax=Bosea sp. LjRoot9 TaxID=3342341 RepID=UPI003F508018
MKVAHVIDRTGNAACHTGSACIAWSGSLSAPDVSVARTMLAGQQVVEATLNAYLAASTLDFGDRLIGARRRWRRAVSRRCSRYPPASVPCAGSPAFARG